MARALLILAIVVALALAASACASDTDRIVFISDRDGNLEIYSISTSGEDETNLTQSGADEFAPKLSPDRKSVAFLSGGPDKTALEVIALDGDRERSEVANADTSIYDYHWSPDSHRLAFIIGQGDQYGVMVASSDGSDIIQIASIPSGEVGSWSKDGQLVAFALRESDGGDERGIYLRNPDGVNEFRLTDSADFTPRWSPTSDHIAFVSDRDGYMDLYVMEVIDGGATDPIRLTRNEAVEYDIAWSPNGKQIAFVSDEHGNPEIYSAAADGEGVTRLTFNSVVDEQPAWSKLGRKIAFVSYLDGDADIFIMDPNGENQRRLTRNDSDDTQPSW